MLTARVLQIGFEIWGCLFCLIAAFYMLFIHWTEEKGRRLMIAIQMSVALLLFMDSLAWIFRGRGDLTGYWMVRISNFLVFAMSYIITGLYHAYVCVNIFHTGIPGRKSGAFLRGILAYGIEALGLIVLCISQVTDFYYYFDAGNFYHRAAWYPVSLLFAELAVLLDFSLLLQYRRRIGRESFLAMISYIVLPVAAAIVLVFFYGLSLINIAICISTQIMFLVALIDQSRMLRQKEKELYDMRIDMMLSQIGPHFIYNTLTTIRYLCKKDPEQATETIDEFSRYLRGNLDSLTRKGMIPFAEELEHVRNYLAIEKKRFGERVNVIYEVETEDFRIPALVLQPLVENAVKHGITKRAEGGTILLKVGRVGEEYEIQVKDDGIGFDSSKAPEDGRVHIGIENVRNRLRDICGGTLEVTGIPGKGTCAVIRLKN